jgi:L-threonylcarbamoyladenylate synthase
MKTEIIKINPGHIERNKIRYAARVLKNGGIVAFPTETVYGLGVNLNESSAVDKLQQIKERPKGKRFTIHLSAKEEIYKYAEIKPPLNRIIEKLLPGPLTLILNDRGGRKLGLRLPENLIARNLIKEAAFPVGAPSANPAGKTPACTARAVWKYFKNKINLIIDGGKTKFCQSSSVLEIDGEDYRILREGPIPAAQIDKFFQRIRTVLLVCTGNSCRSVMAGGLLEKILTEKGAKFDIMTAGTGALPGSRPTPETIAMMKERNVDISDYRARPLNQTLIKKADLILTMQEVHKQRILDLVPGAKDKTFLLSEFAEPANRDNFEEISDPIGQPLEVYRQCVKAIQKYIIKIAERLLADPYNTV